MYDFTVGMRLRKAYNRPNAMDYISLIFDDFLAFSGDRRFGDDPSIIGGIAFLDNMPITVIGQMRGKTWDEQIKYNFSMGQPEGFRKALRLIKQAEKFRRPVISFVDTIGAYPGISAEERGQSNAIAEILMEGMNAKTPIISILIGNGGSGGALALCTANEIVSLQHATLSSISPKACASILWKDSTREIEAMELLKMTANDLRDFGVVDVILNEPVGGAQQDLSAMAMDIKKCLLETLPKYCKMSELEIIEHRREKFKKCSRIFPTAQN